MNGLIIAKKRIEIATITMRRADFWKLPRFIRHPASEISDRASTSNDWSSLVSAIYSLLVEIAAGSGSIVGSSFEELSTVIGETKGRCGVCLDTQHMFASGYDVCTRILKSLRKKR